MGQIIDLNILFMRKLLLILCLAVKTICFPQNSNKVAISFKVDSCSIDSNTVHTGITIKNLSYKTIECLLREDYKHYLFQTFKIKNTIINDTVIISLLDIKIQADSCCSSNGNRNVITHSYSYSNMNLLKIKGRKQIILKFDFDRKVFLSAKYLKVVLNFRNRFPDHIKISVFQLPDHSAKKANSCDVGNMFRKSDSCYCYRIQRSGKQKGLFG